MACFGLVARQALHAMFRVRGTNGNKKEFIGQLGTIVVYQKSLIFPPFKKNLLRMTKKGRACFLFCENKESTRDGFIHITKMVNSASIIFKMAFFVKFSRQIGEK